MSASLKKLTLAITTAFGACGVPSIVGAQTNGACPDLSSFRTDNVLQGFDLGKMDAFWYEQAYIDIAQVGSRCQTLNTTVNVAEGSMQTAFKVDYGAIPFTIIEKYAPNDNRSAGMFVKTAQMPGAQLLKLPTVIVDVEQATSKNGKNSSASYSSAILYSCTVKLDVPIHELVFMTTDKIISDATISQMEAIARNAGISWKEGDLHHVDWSASGENCKSSSRP